MYLDELLELKKRGIPRGIFSVCSAHAAVLKQTLLTCRDNKLPALIEATCNQVNQYGGYTGMQPVDFVSYVQKIANEVQFPNEEIILGGDHLGPSVWQKEPEHVAMPKAEELVRLYVKAGFTKIHLDCSMRLADDPPGALDPRISALRTARLATQAELAGGESIRYVVGTEVPVPGGTTEHEDGVNITRIEDVRHTIEVTHEAFLDAGLCTPWERVFAVVVQPGVEFGDDFVLPYVSESARELSGFIDRYPLVYEAHSTDYQTRQALSAMVRDHFAILKVGPGLTFSFREAVFALAQIEEINLPIDQRSNIIIRLDEVMLKQPGYWQSYYHGSEAEKAFKRKFSLSDRIRYYWTHPDIQESLNQLLVNLQGVSLPASLVREYLPELIDQKNENQYFSADEVISGKIQRVLNDYAAACNPHIAIPA